MKCGEAGGALPREVRGFCLLAHTVHYLLKIRKPPMIQQYLVEGARFESKSPEVQLNWGKSPPDPAVASHPRVLVAEDDPGLRELMVRLLAFEGYLVTQASDAFALLSAMQASRQNGDEMFDLIVTDVRMPGLTGLDALARLRESGCHTPAIVVSAMPRDMVQHQVEALDAIFIPKPFALENLRRVANQAIYDNQKDTPVNRE